MNKDLILKLADELEADAEREDGIKFDFTDWGYSVTPENPLSCGTTGCAMAVAALSGAFKEQGLSARFYSEGSGIEFMLHGTHIGAITAASRVFGIPEPNAAYLFTEDGDLYALRESEGEREVAHRLRRYVALNGNVRAVQIEMVERKLEKSLR